MSRATIEDVAQQAGVSVATVSRALRGLPNVAESTRVRVEAAAAELGYRAHTAAAWLASGRTRTIGVAAPWFHIWYTGAVLSGVQQVLTAAGYDLVVYGATSAEHRQQFLDRVPGLQTRVDGILLIDFYLRTEHVQRLDASGLAVVSIGNVQPGLTTIGIDNQGAAKAAVDYLIAKGHRRIALAGSERDSAFRSPVLDERRAGYQEALRDAGLEPDPVLEYTHNLDTSHGPEAFDQLMSIDPPPTAIFFLSDEMAMGALGHARRRGVSVPADVSVMGFDDHDLSEAAGLTTMRQPVRALGVAAAERLLEKLSEPIERTAGVIACKIVERESVAPPR